MVLQKYMSLLLALALPAISGCATVARLSGTDPYMGRPAPVTDQARAYALHLAGVIHERRGEFDQAVAAWNGVSRIDKQALAPRLRLIRAHLRRGEYEEALALCRAALQHAPDLAELWVVYGELNHRQRHIEAAIAAFKKTIELKPDDLTGYGALIELQESTNDLVAAIDIYERLIERSPNSAALYYQLGINLARINDTEYARETFEKVLELEPRISRARFFLGLVLFELGDFERSAAELALYVAERSDDTAALEYRAAALARAGNLEAGRRVLEQVLAGSEAAPKHYLQHAWLLHELGYVERAQQFSLEAGAYLFADMLFTCDLLHTVAPEDWPATLWDDRFALEEVESESDLFISAVLAMYDKQAAGDKTLAMLDALENAAGFSPALSLFRARILLTLERHREALAALDAILANGVASKYIHHHSAFAYEALDDYHNTEAHLRAYLDIDPENPDMLNFLGYFYAEHNVHLDEAEELLQRALKHDPDNPFYLDSLGWIYYRQGKAEEAAQLIRRAIYGMESDDPILRDHLGDVYLLKGDVERALAEWRRALRLDPSLNEVREKIEEHSPSLDL